VRPLYCLVTSLDRDAEFAAQVAQSIRPVSGVYTHLCSIDSIEPQSIHDPDVVLMALDRTSVEHGIALSLRLRKEAARCNVVAAGAAFERRALTRLLSAGAFDFVSWPATGDEIATRLFRAAGRVRYAESESAALIDPRLKGLVGTSAALRSELAKLPTIAGCSSGVLIIGETGTGKEVCAQAIHYLSPRSSKPWVAVNCGAIPSELIESELFGHLRGAYTSALHSRQGLASEAEGGSLFLDDVDCLPLVSQTRLLRFLQEKEYRPVGSNAVKRADVRIIAASNRQLPQMVARGEFRQDLYYRLNVLTLNLPPLRDRREDIAPLSRLFVRQFAEQLGRPVVDISPPAMALLLQHSWPGNVRELKHVLERAVLMTSNPALIAADFQIPGCASAETEDPSFRAAKSRAVCSFERAFIERLLQAHSGNVTQAAKAARKNRRAFFELMRKHEIESGPYRGGALH
jgi:two-component system, NtrC family, response regulator GlrR